MSRTIYFPALQSDIKDIIKKNNAFVREHWMTSSLFFIAMLSSFNLTGIVTFLLLLTTIITFLVQLYHSITLKNAKKQGKALFFAKRKNERLRHLYTFLGLLFVAWISMSTFMGGLFFVIALHSLFKYIFYIPSIVFLANDFELIISRKHKSKIFDFSYANRLRFIYNMISFEHPVTGKTTWRDINMNRDKIKEIKEFLSDNFGKEMVLNPTTGLPYST